MIEKLRNVLVAIRWRIRALAKVFQRHPDRSTAEDSANEKPAGHDPAGCFVDRDPS
ncbi:hypothetical protein MKK88_20650 [Methylobacterium sp. E-005]|uniref:hypothetical protein n=1 Tax=Methylobacterium sp. E-005 TaxID=2836549 RepID=UPI001FB8B7D3|nr:hypothetical protein [Methylobacterium sp. E-005]MCJ2088377.1 hypothetical protein [Methylobacterium sp. E-005]